MAKKVNAQNNYVKLGMILVVVILVTLISANLYTNARTRRVENGYLTTRVSSIEFKELENVLLEFSGDMFLYISYTGNPDIHTLDVGLRRILRTNELTDQFVYLNMRSQMSDNPNYLADLNEILGLETGQIRVLPAILYYRDNELFEVMDSYRSLLRPSDFSHLLDKFEIISR